MKQLVSNYTINTTSKTITLTDFGTLVKERILLITDVTNQTNVYTFNTTTGVTVSGNVITFTTFTPGANTDALQIFYDTKQGDPHYDDYQLVNDAASNNVVQTGNATAADTVSTSTAGQGSQQIVSGTPTANSAVVLTIPLINGTAESFSNVVIDTSTSTFVGTYFFERSANNGQTWTAFNCFIAGTADQTNNAALPGVYHGNAAGITAVRVRVTAYTSGTLAVRIQLGIGTGTITVGNPIRLYDGANKVQATIKPASTAPTGTDTAIVTTTSPNSPEVSSLSTIATNGATGAKQDTGNTSLATVATNTGRIPAQGSALTTASLPVNLASDQIATIAGISVRDAYSTQTYTITATGTSMTTPVDMTGNGWRYASVHVVSLGTGVTLTFQTSNDNTNWITQGMQPSNSTVSLPVTNGVASNIYAGPIFGRYFRLNNSNQTAGTTSVVVTFSNTPVTIPVISGQVAVNGTVATYAGASSAGAGLTPYLNTAQLAAASTVATGNRRLHFQHIYNPNTSVVYLQVFNKLIANVTVGTTTPDQSWPLLPSSLLEDGLPISLQFSLGIVIAATTTATGSTAPTTGLVVNLGYV